MGFASSLVGPVPGSRASLAPGRLLLSGAEFWVDAALSGRAGGKLLNLGTGGSALDATFGSTTGSDANDPVDLSWAGVNYLYLPGAGANYAEAPHNANLAVTGDIDIVVRVGLDDWTPASDQSLISKRVTAGQHCYQFSVVNTSGALAFSAILDGTTLSTATSSAAPPFVDGSSYWVRATRVASTGAVTFYYAADQATEPSSWTQLGTTASTTSGSLFNGTDNVQVGCNRNGLNLAQGKFYRAIVRNGIGGTTVFDADFTRGITSGGQATFTESSANAATVTINRATSGRKAVAVVRNVMLLGTDDRLEVADNALINFGAAQDFTLVAVSRLWATAAASARFFDKDNAAQRYLLLVNGTGANNATLQVRDAVPNTVTSTAATAGTLGNLTVYAGRMNRTTNLIDVFTNNNVSTTTSVAAVGDTTNVAPLRIGGGTAGFNDMELVAAAVFRRALTAADIAAIVAWYGAS